MSETESHTFSLSDLGIGQSARIMEFETVELEVALIQLGVTPGDICEMANIAPFGDPVAIAVNGTKVSIRKKDAARILVSQNGQA